MKIKGYWIISGISFLMLFQNCAGHGFNDANGPDIIAIDDVSDVDVLGEADSLLEDDGVHSFICVLDGPGESIRLAVLGDKLYATDSNEDSQVVCMSQSACRNIVSAKYQVKAPAFRGFCKNQTSNNVVLSNAEIHSLVVSNP